MNEKREKREPLEARDQREKPDAKKFTEVRESYEEVRYDYFETASFYILLGKYAKMPVRDMGQAVEAARQQSTNTRWAEITILRQSLFGDQHLSIEEGEEYLRNNFAIITGRIIDSYTETEEEADERLAEVLEQYPQFVNSICIEAI